MALKGRDASWFSIRQKRPLWIWGNNTASRLLSWLICIHRVRFTQPDGTLFLSKSTYMDAPPGVPGVSKNHIFLQIKLLSTCARNEPKLKKKSSKMPVFWQFFDLSAIYTQYLHTKSPWACLVDNGASFVTPGVPGGASILKISWFLYLFLIFLNGGPICFHKIQNKVWS